MDISCLLLFALQTGPPEFPSDECKEHKLIFPGFYLQAFAVRSKALSPLKLRSGPKFRTWTLRQKSIHFLPSSYTSWTADNSISQGHTNCHHHLKNKKTIENNSSNNDFQSLKSKEIESWNVLKTVIIRHHVMCMWQDSARLSDYLSTQSFTL